MGYWRLHLFAILFIRSRGEGQVCVVGGWKGYRRINPYTEHAHTVPQVHLDLPMYSQSVVSHSTILHFPYCTHTGS